MDEVKICFLPVGCCRLSAELCLQDFPLRPLRQERFECRKTLHVLSASSQSHTHLVAREPVWKVEIKVTLGLGSSCKEWFLWLKLQGVRV